MSVIIAKIVVFIVGIVIGFVWGLAAGIHYAMKEMARQSEESTELNQDDDFAPPTP